MFKILYNYIIIVKEYNFLILIHFTNIKCIYLLSILWKLSNIFSYPITHETKKFKYFIND